MNGQKYVFRVIVPIAGSNEICLCVTTTPEGAATVMASLLMAEINRPDWIRVEPAPAPPGS